MHKVLNSIPKTKKKKKKKRKERKEKKGKKCTAFIQPKMEPKLASNPDPPASASPVLDYRHAPPCPAPVFLK
jgi:hypothetical protein